jgi:hypothetical protein
MSGPVFSSVELTEETLLDFSLAGLIDFQGCLSLLFFDRHPHSSTTVRLHGKTSF